MFNLDFSCWHKRPTKNWGADFNLEAVWGEALESHPPGFEYWLCQLLIVWPGQSSNEDNTANRIHYLWGLKERTYVSTVYRDAPGKMWIPASRGTRHSDVKVTRNDSVEWLWRSETHLHVWIMKFALLIPSCSVCITQDIYQLCTVEKMVSVCSF